MLAALVFAAIPCGRADGKSTDAAAKEIADRKAAVKEANRQAQLRARLRDVTPIVRFLTPEEIAALGAPPPPARKPTPSFRGLPPDQWKARQREFWESEQADLLHWGDSLTEAQRAALERAAEAAQARAAKQARVFNPEALPDPTAGYSWREDAAGSGLSAKELERLDRDKLLIEDVQVKQSFEAYTGAGPFFITTDSLLNGFHVLFEDSFRELEYRRVSQLRVALDHMLRDARATVKTSTVPGISVAWRQAQLSIGPAMRLLGSPLEQLDPDVRAEIERQVALVREADGAALPDWLGPPSPAFLAIDYGRFKPTGFYAEGYYLADYFRAVRWLQIVPFRLEREPESLALALLARSSVEQAGSWNRRQPLEMYSRWLGSGNERDLVRAGGPFAAVYPRPDLTVETIQSWHHGIAARGDPEGEYPVNEDIRLPPAALGPEQAPFHILGTLRFPEAGLFQRLADSGESVSGLDLAAYLASDLARRSISTNAASIVLQAQKAGEKPSRRQTDLYASYLEVLATLFAPPEPDAPEFLRRDAWAAKSCQTALAAWAQMRHTFSLQARESALYLGMIRVPPGFIEPNPQFFHQFARLSEQIEAQLGEDGAFEPSGLLEAEELRRAASQIEEITRKDADLSANEFVRDLYSIARNDARAVDYERRCERHGGLPGDRRGAELQEFNRTIVAEMRAEADDLASATTRATADVSELRERWRRLERIAYQLEAMVQKQLRRRPWSEDESSFVRAYGESLAYVMGYFGNSWLSPRDNAPRWAEVHRDLRARKNLSVCVGRPRRLYVLYPWNGGEILCRGSVMSYYEYGESGSLTDAEWQSKLDSSDAPSQPAWIEAIMAR